MCGPGNSNMCPIEVFVILLLHSNDPGVQQKVKGL